MSIPIGGYTFEGPFFGTVSLKDRSGVYAILCQAPDGKYQVLDVGESATVKSRIENHDRASCWSRNCSNGTLTVAVLYTPGSQQGGRRAIEQALRDSFDPPCGKQ